MIARRFFIALLAWIPLVVSNSVHAEIDSSSAAMTAFKKAATGFAYLKADFLMQKQSSSVKELLESRGEVVLVKDCGLIWHVQKPFDSTQVFLKDKTLVLENGKVVSSAVGQTNSSAFNSVSEALKDPEEALRTQFFVNGKTDSKGWELRLEPRQESMQQFFIEMHLRGFENLETWTLFRTERDWTRVHFMNIQKSTKIPSDVLAKFAKFQ